jgi:hypothetical protein
MKLRLDAVFIDILHEAYTLEDPKCEKKYSQAIGLFCTLGTVRIKAAQKMLVKLIPGVNFINILLVRFFVQKSVL